MEHSPFPPEIRASFRDQYVKMGITGQEADTLFDLAENAVNKAFDSLMLSSDAAQVIGQGYNVLTLAVQLLAVRTDATLKAIRAAVRDQPGIATAEFEIAVGGGDSAHHPV